MYCYHFTGQTFLSAVVSKPGALQVRKGVPQGSALGPLYSPNTEVVQSISGSSH